MTDASMYPPVTPYLLYEDVAAALDWLTRVFGFTERLRFASDDGVVNHAEMVTGPGGLVLLGHPGPEYRNPRNLGGATALVQVYVADVEGHFARATEQGATIIRPPADEVYGDRRYDAEDLEGHPWSFSQRIAEVPPEEWGATPA